MKLYASTAGLFLESEQTKPLLSSLTLTFLTLNPTLSPGIASSKDWWNISTGVTLAVSCVGANVTTIPGFKIPVSTLPTGTVPIPPILYTSYKGSLNGLSVGLLGGWILSNA